MTYCLGILLKDGIVMAADSRTNAGVDYISTFRKLNVFEKPGERVIALATAGNLATSQAVVSMIGERLGDPHGENGIMAAESMFAVAQIIGGTLRQVIDEHGDAVRKDGGDPSATFILGGQIRDRSPRLFLIYAAGNFIEATHETPFLQIGENKYGKPILDRTVDFDMLMDRAVKAALVSFDSTMRSNLSVGTPIDLITILAGKQRIERHATISEDDPYFAALRRQYGDGIVSVFEGLPDPEISEWPMGPSC
ncbi:MAG: peptidase [Alphaproteobacteria bacterium]